MYILFHVINSCNQWNRFWGAPTKGFSNPTTCVTKKNMWRIIDCCVKCVANSAYLASFNLFSLLLFVMRGLLIVIGYIHTYYYHHAFLVFCLLMATPTNWLLIITWYYVKKKGCIGFTLFFTRKYNFSDLPIFWADLSFFFKSGFKN